MANAARNKVPVLLLKTKSTPVDSYEDYFSTLDSSKYDPVFVPVLEHRFRDDALRQVRDDVTEGGFLPNTESSLAKYGAIIFTSQRAVEAFAKIVNDIRTKEQSDLSRLLPERVPFYVVGPATARGLKALGLPCPVIGEETGNGDNLASFILEHYNNLHPGLTKPAILFLVGEKRRDIIPKTLQSQALTPDRRSKVDELVIYETGELQSFKSNFSSLFKGYRDAGVPYQWVVVFSPTGCRAMLESLGLLDTQTKKVTSIEDGRKIFIATIGPTTKDYLITEFGYSPDVCAEKPSPEGIADGIRSFYHASG